MSNLSDWSDSIQESGKQRRREEEKVENYLLAQPHEVFEENGMVCAIWKSIDCISVAFFYPSGRLNIHSLEQYSHAFLAALNRVALHGKVVSSQRIEEEENNDDEDK